MKVRANAWATGDVATLRQLTHVDNASACIAVVMNAQVMQDRGYTDWPERRMAAWLAAVEAAVARNRSTVTVLSINQNPRAGRLRRAVARPGYVVEDP